MTFKIGDKVYLPRERFNPGQYFGHIIRFRDLEGVTGDTVVDVVVENGRIIKEYLKMIKLAEDPNNLFKMLL